MERRTLENIAIFATVMAAGGWASAFINAGAVTSLHRVIEQHAADAAKRCAPEVGQGGPVSLIDAEGQFGLLGVHGRAVGEFNRHVPGDGAAEQGCPDKGTSRQHHPISDDRAGRAPQYRAGQQSDDQHHHARHPHDALPLNAERQFTASPARREA